jgi:hypothetical protein
MERTLMSDCVHFESRYSEEARRLSVYDGGIFVFAPRKTTLALCSFAQSMIEEAFLPLDPRTAQYSIPVEQYVSIVAPLKPQFIHHPRTLQLVRDAVEELGCDLTRTCIDVPRLRMVTHGGYLTSGVGYAHHPHRDTWYSAPMCQLNWWLPIYDFDANSSMAFHNRYFRRHIKNGSGSFNYYDWNANGRRNAANYIKSDERKQPGAEEPLDLEPQLRVVCQAGGIIVFSAAHLHSTVPNTSGQTRYSIDFRTVNLDDLVTNRGAPNVDSTSEGTSLRDFLLGADFTKIPEKVIKPYDSGNVGRGVLVFEPTVSEQ